MSDRAFVPGPLKDFADRVGVRNLVLHDQDLC